jgi:hypothetical protein
MGGWFKLAPLMIGKALDISLIIAGPTLELWLAIILARRRLYKQFPWFFLYTCFSVFSGIALPLTSRFGSYPLFFNAFSIGQAIYAVLGLLAMNESFSQVLTPYYLGRRWFRALLPVLVLIVVCLSIWKWLGHAPIQASKLMGALISFGLASDYLLSAVFGLFGIFVLFWQVRWQQYPFGIMKGFGLFSIVGMLAHLLRSDIGTKMNWFFAYAPPVAYIVACLIWLGAFLRPEPQEQANKPSSLVNVDELVELLDRLLKAIR